MCFAYFVFDISEKSCGFAFMKIVVVFITVSVVIRVSLLKEEVGSLVLSLCFQTVGALECGGEKGYKWRAKKKGRVLHKM